MLASMGHIMPDPRRPASNARDAFKRIYKIGMIFVTMALGGGAVLAYLSATPGNGLLLISGILGVLTLMSGLSISRLDDQDARAETWGEIGSDIRNLVKVSIHPTYAEPEVHRVDTAKVEEAKRMSSNGVPIDDICGMIDPDHHAHDPAHQEAFRRIVQAMIDN